MKRFLIISICTIICAVCAAKSVTIDGVTYKFYSYSKNTVIVMGIDPKLSEVTIHGKITYEGKDYEVEFQANDFKHQPLSSKNCPLLRTIILDENWTETPEGYWINGTITKVVLPNSIKKIRDGAFKGCSSLKNVNIPNSVTVIGIEAFAWCSSLEYISIPNSVTIIGSEAFEGCSHLKTVIGLYDGIDYSLSDIHKTPYGKSGKWHFIEYTNSYMIPKIKEWQQKRDFETTAEYKARVTPENQQKKMQEYLAKAIKEYTDKNKIQVTLGQYDADAEVFTLNSNYGTKYVKVPRSAAPDFKEGFANAAFEPSYVMGNDFPKVADMIIFVNGKSYTTEKSAVEQSNYDLAIDLPDIDLGIGKDGNQNSASKPLVVDRTIDESIPNTTQNNTITFAVIIGNERYTRVAQVPYANNDARIFAEYCKKTLGLPEKNVKVYENATYGTMMGAVSDMQKIAKAFKGDANIIFYYAGHGIPDEATGDGYLLPIDADGLNMRVCYPLSQLYKELGEMQARSVTCFLDACFSGSQRGDGMVVAARGVAIKAKSDRPTGHTIVFTAATDKQTAYPYKEKGHGMFTYYLLKKLRDTKGDCTLGELGQYICDEVAKQAIVTNGKEQTPVVLTSDGVLDNWKNMKLK